MGDTILAGAGLCDTNIVQSICNQAPKIIQYLIDCGVPFDQHDNGNYRLTKEGAHSHSRIFHVKTGTFQNIDPSVSLLYYAVAPFFSPFPFPLSFFLLRRRRKVYTAGSFGFCSLRNMDPHFGKPPGRDEDNPL